MASAAHKCAADGCDKAGAMRCPTCKELGVDEGSHFCGKECFQKAWNEHKLVHKRYKQAQEAALALIAKAAPVKGGRRLPAGFEDFSFTGKLRPGVVSPMMKVPPGIPKPDHADTGLPRAELAERGSNVIAINTPAQIASMRKVCAMGREILDIAASMLRPGVTGDAIDKVVFQETVSRGAYPSPLNYHSFPKSFCISVNEVICHGIPDSRPLEDGDIVNLDISVFYDGHHADLNETYIVGNVDATGVRLVKCAYDCLAAAVAVCKPGLMYRALGDVISKVAAEAGFSVVKSFCGHGVNRLFHTTPNVPHYAKNKAVGFMRAGHTFTIEPMINEGVAGDEMWPDNWTAVTRDGKRSAQFEHTLLVTETGVEILTARKGTSTTAMAPWDEAAFRRPLPEGASSSCSSSGVAAASSSSSSSESSSGSSSSSGGGPSGGAAAAASGDSQ